MNNPQKKGHTIINLTGKQFNPELIGNFLMRLAYALIIGSPSDGKITKDKIKYLSSPLTP